MTEARGVTSRREFSPPAAGSSSNQHARYTRVADAGAFSERAGRCRIQALPLTLRYGAFREKIREKNRAVIVLVSSSLYLQESVRAQCKVGAKRRVSHPERTRMSQTNRKPISAVRY